MKRIKSEQNIVSEKEKQLEENLLCAVFILLALFIVLLRTAWICDDACISFRTVDNFLHGYGLRWNISERVQTYTNPLMVFCMIILCFFTKEYYLTAMIFNICCTFAAVLIFMFGIAKGKANRFALPMVFLLCSKAFIDFSTSGLENSLEYLIAAIFYYFYFKRDKFSRKHLIGISFIGCVALLNRMDTILLFLPALFDAFFLKGEDKWYRNILPGFIGIIPFVLWEIFSLFYYGFLFPNTAYAKLNSGIPLAEYMQQGVIYYLETLNRDPITMITILLAVGCAIYLFVMTKNHKALCGGIGMLLYGIYIVRVGGDFMGGRFFAVVIFIGGVLLSEIQLSSKQIVCLAVGFIFYTSQLPMNNLMSDMTYGGAGGGILGSGIADERSYYYSSTGLLNVLRTNGELAFNRHNLKSRAEATKLADEKVIVTNNLGFYGLTAGPNIHIIDEYALGDALLARLPAKYNLNWRIGHLDRAIPEGYIDSIENGENLLDDPQLAEYCNVLHNIISGEVFSKERFKQIVNFNLGKYDYLIDKDFYRGYIAANQMMIENFSKIIKTADVWNNPNAWILNKNGTEILLNEMTYWQKISFFADNNDDYWLLIRKNDNIIYRENTGTVKGAGMQLREVILPKEIAMQGYNTVIIIPKGGDGSYSAGYLQFN